MDIASQTFTAISALYSGMNKATLSGAIDVVVVRQPDGSLKCSPFHIRFGKLNVWAPAEKVRTDADADTPPSMTSPSTHHTLHFCGTLATEGGVCPAWWLCLLRWLWLYMHTCTCVDVSVLCVCASVLVCMSCRVVSCRMWKSPLRLLTILWSLAECVRACEEQLEERSGAEGGWGWWRTWW
eukprot:m.180276 g.180276  ORF g.180276 m.180276 type:complete len:182 (-) comp24550_c0_seq7:15-560(-)